jgi:hypothetical protein
VDHIQALRLAPPTGLDGRGIAGHRGPRHGEMVSTRRARGPPTVGASAAQQGIVGACRPGARSASGQGPDARWVLGAAKSRSL